MKIASAELQFAATHQLFQQRETQESLRVWVGERPADGREVAQSARERRDPVSLSAEGLASAASDVPAEAEDAIDADPRLTLIRIMIEALTGKKIRIFDAEELQAAHSRSNRQAEAPDTPSQPPPAGFGIEYDASHSITEIEQTSFTATGSVRTADGREIKFDLALEMSRHYHEEQQVSIRLGDAARKVDPLVLNFSGNAAELTDQRFSFDLDADGQADNIARLAGGSGYLAFDRDANGRIDNGRELFGPASGDGFAELSALDDDGNGWIDESDAAFQTLKVWNGSPEGGLQSLAEAGVGAIALSRIATPFDVKNGINELLGQIRTSGIFLHEDGRAGTIQQIDLTA